MKLNISYPTVRIVYDRRKKASSVTPGAIDLEINHNGKRKWISTGVRILPKQWSQGQLPLGKLHLEYIL